MRLIVRIGALVLASGALTACESGLSTSAQTNSAIDPSVESAAAAASPVLPVLLIDIHGSEVTRGSKVPGTLRVIEQHDGSLEALASSPVSARSPVSLEVRGETTATFPKKSYDLELNDDRGKDRDLPLLGLPAGSDWVLHGCGRDETCLRNAFVYQLTREFGGYAPRTEFVELVVDGTYEGLYVLTEKIRPSRARVNLPKPAADRDTGDITGGYIFKMDLAEGAPGDPVPRDWVSAVNPLVYSYYYPRFDDITPAQRSYLQDHMNRFEALMNSDSWNDPREGYSAWLDIPSWVDFALIQELAVNVDAYFKSVYLQKWPDARGGKLALGPVWDFDTALGVVEFRGGREMDAWAHEMNRFGSSGVPYTPPGEVPFVPPYWEKLWTDPPFQQALRCRWDEMRKGPLRLDRMFATIDGWVERLAAAQARDGALWDNPSPELYPEEVAYLKQCLEERLVWMDEHLPGDCS